VVIAADTGSCTAETINTPGGLRIDLKGFWGDPIFIPFWRIRGRLDKIRFGFMNPIIGLLQIHNEIPQNRGYSQGF